MSVVFITTDARAWRAKAGDTGRASRDSAQSVGSGRCLVRPGLPLAAPSRSANLGEGEVLGARHLQDLAAERPLVDG